MADQDDKKVTGGAQEAEAGLEQLKAAKAEAEAKAIRALADLQNAKKRMEEEKASFAVFANQMLILKVLDIYENYHRLMTHKPTDLKMDEWHKGLELIDEQFKKFLEQQGVSMVEAKPGDAIDPNKHEAVMTGDGKDGEILEVFSPGYEMGGRAIKTAKVKVGKRAA